MDNMPSLVERLHIIVDRVTVVEKKIGWNFSTLKETLEEAAKTIEEYERQNKGRS